MSPYSTASAQLQLAALTKAAKDLIASLVAEARPEAAGALDAANHSMALFDAIMQAQINGKASFPPALKPLERAMNDVLTQAGHDLNQGIPEGTDPDEALARLEEGQAAITQASIAGFMMLTHLGRAMAKASTTD